MGVCLGLNWLRTLAVTPTERRESAAILPQAVGDRIQAVSRLRTGRSRVVVLCSSKTEARSASCVEVRLRLPSEVLPSEVLPSEVLLAIVPRVRVWASRPLG